MVALSRAVLKQLAEVSGHGTTLVSVYLGGGRPVHDALNLLRGEVAQAGNIKSRTTRQAVETSLTQAVSFIAAEYAKGTPPAGVAVFSGAGTVVAVEPPAPLPSLYRCDSKFVLGPLESMLVSKQVFGLVVIDRKEASLGVLHGTSIRPVRNMGSLVPQKVNRGGQSQARIQRQADNAVTEWFEEVAEAATLAFLPDIDTFTAILVGGPGDTRRAWLRESHLDHRVKAKVLPTTFDTGYTDEFQGLRELVSAAASTVDHMEIEVERRAVREFLDGVRTGKAVYGPAQVEEAFLHGKVEKLLVTEGTTVHGRAFEAERDGTVEVVSIGTETDEGKQFHAMGGIGVMLRW